MATNTGVLLTTLIAFRRGDFSVRMPNDWTGVHGMIAGDPSGGVT